MSTWKKRVGELRLATVNAWLDPEKVEYRHGLFDALQIMTGEDGEFLYGEIEHEAQVKAELIERFEKRLL